LITEKFIKETFLRMLLSGPNGELGDIFVANGLPRHYTINTSIQRLFADPVFHQYVSGQLGDAEFDHYGSYMYPELAGFWSSIKNIGKAIFHAGKKAISAVVKIPQIIITKGVPTVIEGAVKVVTKVPDIVAKIGKHAASAFSSIVNFFEKNPKFAEFAGQLAIGAITANQARIASARTEAEAEAIGAQIAQDVITSQVPQELHHRQINPQMQAYYRQLYQQVTKKPVDYTPFILMGGIALVTVLLLTRQK
jgi:hypothetical protein